MVAGHVVDPLLIVSVVDVAVSELVDLRARLAARHVEPWIVEQLPEAVCGCLGVLDGAVRLEVIIVVVSHIDQLEPAPVIVIRVVLPMHPCELLHHVEGRTLRNRYPRSLKEAEVEFEVVSDDELRALQDMLDALLAGRYRLLVGHHSGRYPVYALCLRPSLAMLGLVHLVQEFVSVSIGDAEREYLVVPERLQTCCLGVQHDDLSRLVRLETLDFRCHSGHLLCRCGASCITFGSLFRHARCIAGHNHQGILLLVGALSVALYKLVFCSVVLLRMTLPATDVVWRTPKFNSNNIGVLKSELYATLLPCAIGAELYANPICQLFLGDSLAFTDFLKHESHGRQLLCDIKQRHKYKENSY